MELIKEKIDAQVNYSQTHSVPMFAPSDGKCYKCKQQIYAKITIEEATNKLITGCPHCSCSFVD